MSLLINKAKVEQMISNFRTISTLQITLFDTKYESILPLTKAQIARNSRFAFCNYLKLHPVFAERCALCDQCAFEHVNKTKEPYVYKCHIGLTEAVSPIIFENDIMGYLMIGQFLNTSHGDELDINSLVQFAQDEDVLRSYYEDLQKLNNKEVEAWLDIIRSYTGYLTSNNFIALNNENHFKNIEQYIADNLANKITADIICQEKFISKSKLYKIIKEATGMNFGEYVVSCRMKLAKDLLINTNQSVGEIAYMVGIYDFSYFSKYFYKHTGLTPNKFRQKNKNNIEEGFKNE